MSSKISRNNALKTGALLLILGCFAVSGALRAGEALEAYEKEAMERARMVQVAAKTTQNAAPRIDAAEAATEVEPEMAALEMAEAPKAAADAETAEAEVQTAALTLDEAAIADGEISTASTPSDKKKRAEKAEARERAHQMAENASHGGDADKAARLLMSLREREAELDAFSERLRQRQVELDAAAKRVEERIRELERSKEEFAALVASVDQAAERDVEHLVEMYSKMKPKDAGALFDAMSPKFAAGFLGRMRADKASAIMSKMSTEKAYVVSLELAGRNVQQSPGAPAPGFGQ